MAAGLSFARLGTFAGVIFSITSSFTASSSTGSSIITTERYGLALFETIFSRFTSDLVPFEEDRAAVLLLEHGDDGRLHERLVAGRAPDDELLRLAAHEGGHAERRHGGRRAHGTGEELSTGHSKLVHRGLLTSRIGTRLGGAWPRTSNEDATATSRVPSTLRGQPDRGARGSVPAVRAHRAPLFEEKAASLRQAVEALGASGKDLTLRLRRQLTAGCAAPARA